MAMSIEAAQNRKAELASKVVDGDVETVADFVAELVNDAITYGVANATFFIASVPHSITSIGTTFYVDGSDYGFSADIVECLILEMLANYYLNQKFNALIATAA